MTPDLSVIIITWNAEKYVKDCLDSVLKSTSHISKEIILIDNGSTDSTKKLLHSYKSENIRFIFQDTNLGVAKARNIGLKEAHGRFLWLLDIDTIVNEQAIETMLSFIKKETSCGITGCKLKNSQGEIQQSCRKFPSLRYKINNILETIFDKSGLSWLKSKIEQQNQSQFYKKTLDSTDPFPVEYIIGACQLIRKEAFNEVGPLDEKIFYGPEDADFCRRMWNKNWKVYYLPQVSIIHEYQQITNKKLISHMSLVHTKALFYYFWKYKSF